jgi:hypothetical protein
LNSASGIYVVTRAASGSAVTRPGGDLEFRGLSVGAIRSTGPNVWAKAVSPNVLPTLLGVDDACRGTVIDEQIPSRFLVGNRYHDDVWDLQMRIETSSERNCFLIRGCGEGFSQVRRLPNGNKFSRAEMGVRLEQVQDTPVRGRSL